VERKHPSELTREELYTLIWSTPVQRAAEEFGISDGVLAKLCRRRQVPMPRRGFWARKEAGKAPAVPSLPDFVPPPPKPKRITAAEQRELDRQREIQEQRDALVAKHASVPLVCFVDDVAAMLGIPKQRVEAHLGEESFPIAQIPYYGLVRKATLRIRRGLTHEAKPCWFKGRVLEFLERPEWERWHQLELPSERAARTCTHCPVHCPAVHEHPYAARWRNRWRNQSW
jgi:hypothetical protein